MTASGMDPTPLSGGPEAHRSYETAALRSDGSLLIGQNTAPALPLFESAFNAFARGTAIRTVNGEVAVEDLQPGEMLRTTEGDAVKVIWIGSSTFVPADTGERVPLIRVMPDSFGQERPNAFLTLGPGARILKTPHDLRGDSNGGPMLTPARRFVDGVNVIEVTPPTPVRLFHLCLARHATFHAAGLAVESFHPGTTALRDLPRDLRDRFLSMFPQISEIGDFGPLAHARAPETQAG